MPYQGNTEDYTDASFSLIKSCQCQVQLSEDKNPHTETPHCSSTVSSLLWSDPSMSGQRDISGFKGSKADVSDQN